MQNLVQAPHSLRIGDKVFSLETPLIMGILNFTPDSFYDGGKYQTEDAVVAHVQQMLEDGVNIVDIGCQSTRPDARLLPLKKEGERLSQVLTIVRKHFPKLPISVDTFRAELAELAAVEFQAGLINDVSAGELDANMFPTIAKHQLAYVAMHMQGTPQDMQDQPQYKDVVLDVIDYFSHKLNKLHQMGIGNVLLDPGFGFGKTLNHNYQLLAHLQEFQILDAPLLIGVSRKSMLYKLLNVTPQETLAATTALHLQALQAGAKVLRVHDVKEAKQACLLYQQLKTAK